MKAHNAVLLQAIIEVGQLNIQQKILDWRALAREDARK
jgi:hypothetical protein